MPDSVDFQEVSIGYPDTTSIYILNLYNVEKTVDIVYNSSTHFGFDPAVIGDSISPFDSLELRLWFNPDSTISYIDTLRVSFNDSLYNVDLSGFGIGAYLVLSDDSLDFGYWEPNGPDYPVRSFTYSNDGNDTLIVYSIESLDSAFYFLPDTVSQIVGDTIAPGGESEPVEIVFIPPIEGLHEGFISLNANAYNAAPNIYVSGTWEPIPVPVTAIINHDYPNVVLNWAPVDTSIYGNPIEVDFYLIFYSELPYNPDSLYFFHGYTADTTYTHFGVAQFSEHMFYNVIAYIGEIGILDALLSQSEPLRWEEVYYLIKNASHQMKCDGVKWEEVYYLIKNASHQMKCDGVKKID
ncbi:hypothetical protein ISS30_04045 [bacterium]|nr:hypothetical protein [bacterium]